jgi:hypothetical protein
MNFNTEIEEIEKRFDKKASTKIIDHAFDGSCCYNNNEGGKGHSECRYPYNPGRENPSGEQCLKLREEHFDIKAFFRAEQAALLSKFAAEINGEEQKIDKDLFLATPNSWYDKTGWNHHHRSVAEKAEEIIKNITK